MSNLPIIASVDAGNGGVNAVVGTASGYKSFYMPSTRAVVSGGNLDLDGGVIATIQHDFVDWYTAGLNGDFTKQRYVYGDNVLTLGTVGIERAIGSGRYGGDLHRFLVGVSLMELGVKTGEIELVLFLPPSLINEQKQTLIDAFLSESVVIQKRGEKQSRQWSYSSVKVLPEGIGAGACLLFDDNGQLCGADLMNGVIAVLDSGVYTLDVLLFQDGKLSVDSIQRATIPNGGINTHIRRPLLDAIHGVDNDFRAVVSLEHVDRVIRSGFMQGDYTLTIAGKTLDLKAELHDLISKYAVWVKNTVFDEYLNGLAGIKAGVLIGGGSILIQNHLQKWFGAKILDLSKHKHTKKINLTEYNAVGGLRFARAKRTQGK